MSTLTYVIGHVAETAYSCHGKLNDRQIYQYLMQAVASTVYQVAVPLYSLRATGLQFALVIHHWPSA